ncbi:lysylphosphatidylglycerol synthase transmembrane domain-containing protein [Actinotalea solisilvae]|uniref:lysylphosphatidylglycerol synthase transmembrane domain-containing protein n=1 Tax=Actinotalea solisilvae TaxID=2072922 RepID=UPI0018F23973|nr:lysylphosphatidylglycerol synthase transmembrane domain-containing protein [Actinotalea solisilvae]
MTYADRTVENPDGDAPATRANPAPSTAPATAEPAHLEEPHTIATARSTKDRVLVLARWVLIVVVVAAASWQVVRQWDDVSVALTRVHPLTAILSFGLVLAGLVAGTLSWQTLLDDMGPKVGVARGGQVCLVGQLGKYVPGSVWAYLLQMELGRQYGIARARVFATSLFAAGIGVVASLVLGLGALPLLLSDQRDLLWLFVLLPVGLVCLHPKVMTWMASLVFRVLRKPPLDHMLRRRVVARSFAWALASYVCFGLHLWLLANSIVDPGVEMILLCAGTIAIGMTAGLFAVVLPSGVGVREAIIVAAFATLMSTGEATALALGSRMLFTMGDLAIAGAATALAVLARRRFVDVDPTAADVARPVAG